MTITIQQAIDTIIAAVPGAPFPETVDVVKAGDPSQPLRGILLTFLATCEAVERAAALGGTLTVSARPGGGCRVEARLPLGAAAPIRERPPT